MKAWKWIMAAGLSLSLAACSSSTGSTTEESTTDNDTTADASAINGTYAIHVDGFDWGAAVTKALITLEEPVDAVTKDTFSVSETKEATDWSDETFPVVVDTFEREVTDAYLCDAEGNKVDEPSKYVMLELGYDPNTGSPLLYTMATGYNTWSDPYVLNVTVKEDAELTSEGNKVEAINLEENFTSKTTSADSFSIDTYTAEDGVVYDYALFEPEEKSDKLVVWLHGMGEGGSIINTDTTDPYVILLANEAANLAGEEFQSIVGGANVLVPQSPTYWMDPVGDGSTYDGSALNNVENGSAFTESLHELIDYVKTETGSEKVVITGASNGGFMTVLMAETYGDEYDGYVPIAEAMRDDLISDEQIEVLAGLPIYFIYAENDPTVDPTVNEEPTIERIKTAGGETIYVAKFPNVVDTSGTYTDEDGNPYEYSGHWSWIYFFNNEAETEDGLSAYQYISDLLNASDQNAGSAAAN